MAKPFSVDLRERVVAAVEQGGLSRREAASRFGVGISTAIAWVRRFRKTGSVAPGQMGGHKPKAIRGEHQILACGTHQGEGLQLAWAGGRARRTRPQGRLPLGVELRPRREAELQKKPCSPASRIAPMSLGDARSGEPIKTGLNPVAWSSSMRPGPRPTWRRSGDGRRAGCGSGPRPPMAAGRP